MSKIDLPPDIKTWAREEVAPGRAESVESLVVEAMRVRRAIAAEHGELVGEAYGSLARGDVTDEATMDAELDRWIREDLAASR